MNSRIQTSIDIAVPPAIDPGVEVRWSCVPKVGEACKFTGLGHAYYYNKLLKGPFAQGFVHLTLRERGESKGKRLFFVPSLHRLLTDVADGIVRPTKDGGLTGDLERDRFSHARSTHVPDQWIRAPRNGETCWFTGLSHGVFYDLLDSAGKRIRVAHLELPDETRSTPIVNLVSIHKYLIDLAEKQATKPAAETATRHAA